MHAPWIGITTSLSTGSTPERAHLNAAYLRAVQQAGGVPVLLPPQLEAAARDALWPRLDALCLTGGGDVDPSRFGEQPHPTIADVSPARDALETDLVHRALRRGLPLLAICRGVQVLNVALGGSLHQDIADEVDTNLAHSQKAPREQPTHEVRVAADSRLLGIVGRWELLVNSFHHQALKVLGRGLRAVAWAPDGVVEGAELQDPDRFVVGVQWHPEDLTGHDAAARALFTALVDAARRPRPSAG